jgi:hypothetical protein
MERHSKLCGVRHRMVLAAAEWRSGSTIARQLVNCRTVIRGGTFSATGQGASVGGGVKRHPRFIPLAMTHS